MLWSFLLFLPLLTLAQANDSDEYYHLQKLPQEEFELEVGHKIDLLESTELWNFLNILMDNNVDFRAFHKKIISKAENSKWAYDIYIFTEILIEQGTNKAILEEILNNKKIIWDTGEWAQQFWKLIMSNNLSIKEDIGYIVDSNGSKTYNLEVYISEKIRLGEIGDKPLLMIDHELTEYPATELIRFLRSLNIKDITVTPKNKSLSLFGQRGADGMLSVLTKML